jgi:hypothetical protein
LTITRAVSGLSRLAIQRAKPRRRRRQPVQIERGAADQRRAVRRRRGLDRLLVQLLQNESVNRRLNALRGSDRRNVVTLDGLERPDIVFGVIPFRFGNRRDGLFPSFNPGRARVNPLRTANLSVRETGDRFMLLRCQNHISYAIFDMKYEI